MEILPGLVIFDRKFLTQKNHIRNQSATLWRTLSLLDLEDVCTVDERRTSSGAPCLFGRLFRFRLFLSRRRTGLKDDAADIQ
jgi:hypothetical protein